MPALDLAEARDRELVVRIGLGDHEAFRGLFGRYAPAAKALALRVVRQSHLAEEIVQEAFMALWKNPDGYDQARGIGEVLVDGHGPSPGGGSRPSRGGASAPRRAIHPRGPRDGAGPVGAGGRDLGAPEERAEVRAALGDLPPEQRRVIELMYFGGRSQSQIATELNLPLGTVKSRTLLGMRRLRGALTEMER